MEQLKQIKNMDLDGNRIQLKIQNKIKKKNYFKYTHLSNIHFNV